MEQPEETPLATVHKYRRCWRAGTRPDRRGIIASSARAGPVILVGPATCFRGGPFFPESTDSSRRPYLGNREGHIGAGGSLAWWLTNLSRRELLSHFKWCDGRPSQASADKPSKAKAGGSAYYSTRLVSYGEMDSRITATPSLPPSLCSGHRDSADAGGRGGFLLAAPLSSLVEMSFPGGRLRMTRFVGAQGTTRPPGGVVFRTPSTRLEHKGNAVASPKPSRRNIDHA